MQGHITELLLIPHFARGHLFVKIAFWLFLLHFLKLPSLLHSDHWDCCIIVEYSQTLIYSFSQVESASSERERSLLIKITELQNRLIICPFLTCLYTFLSGLYTYLSLIFSLTCCRMMNLTNELNSEKLKYEQVSCLWGSILLSLPCFIIMRLGK